MSQVSILIVDDQAPNLVALEAALGNRGYNLVLARSGEDALALAGAQDFAAILLDVQMPGMDGFQAAKHLRKSERSRSTPIIFLTANYPSEDYALQGYEAGAVDYLFKPLNIEVLRAKVGVFVELFEKNLELKRQSELLKELEVAKVRRISERKYRNLVEGIRDGIVWSASVSSLQFTFVSSQAERIAGYPVEQWMTEPGFWDSHLYSDDRARVLAAFDDVREQRSGTTLEHRFVKANGQCIWFHTEVHYDEDTEGSVPEFRGLSVDVTHLKETERALREAIRIRDDFLSMASHELKTPLTPLQLQMQGFIRMIDAGRAEETSAERLKEMLEISDSQVGRLSRLITQLLDVSRINAGRISLDLDEINLSELVAGVVDQLSYEMNVAECRVSLSVTPDVKGKWDRFRLEQVVINMLTNAMKYGAGAPIQIGLDAGDGAARFWVKDHGIGIAPEDHSRIFGRFERAVSSKHFGGLGLGLYITHQIVSMHGGKIEVESEPGKGATFSVELPYDREGRIL